MPKRFPMILSPTDQTDTEEVDATWAPEERYEDFISFYCANSELNDRK